MIGNPKTGTTAPAPAGIYVVPAGSAGSLAAHDPAVRTLARYKSFRVVEAAPQDARTLVAGGAVRRDDMRAVTLQRRSVDPLAEEAQSRSRGEATGLPAGDGPLLVVVQFVGPLKDDWLASLKATGAQLVSYMAENAELVHADGAARAALTDYVAHAPEVRGAFELEAADKIASGVGAGENVRVAVQTIAGDAGAEARADAERVGTPSAPDSRLGPYSTLRMTVDAAKLAQLAADPGVVAIEPDAAPHLLDERQGLLLADGTLGASPGAGYLAAYDSLLFTPSETPSTLPFIVDLTDSAVGNGTTTPTSSDLRVDGSAAGASRIAYVHKLSSEFNDPAANQGCDGHGTINASILAGSNDGSGGGTTDAAGFRYGVGIEPRARLGSTILFRCSGQFDSGGKTLRQIAEDAYQASGPGFSGARIVNNSWGASVPGGAYDATAQEYDAIVRDAVPSQPGAQQMIEVVAAGNGGPGARTINTPATAKNVITVGANESQRAFGTDACDVRNGDANSIQDMATFSSRGPTADARVKPDLVAPGTHLSGLGWQATGSPFDGSRICGTDSNQMGVFFPGTAYSASSGTSHAAPAVSGLAAAARWAYRRAIGPYPSAAMVKAMLVGGATPLSGSGAGVAPGVDQGFGMARLQGAATAGRWFDDEPVVFSQSGQSFTRTFDVTDPLKPVRVTLAWTDAPGPLVGASYVNDLDLEVSADGVLYRGNHIAGGVSTPGGAPDSHDNVESVIVPAGELPSLAVRVRATNIAGDGVPGGGATDQDFALVVSNVGAPTGKAALTTSQVSVTDEDGDGVLEPLEKFSVHASVSNTGPVAADPVTATLTTSAPGVTLTGSPISLGALAPDAPAAPVQPLGGERANNACGETPVISMLLEADAPGAIGAGTRIIVPGSGSTARVAKPATPVTVPDGNAGWTTIPLTIGDPGVVDDLDVQLTQINHAWVSDLEIALESPDGTIVMLADNTGAGGQNFTGTILDDDADVPIQSATTAGAPFTGRWKPAQPLSAFAGKTLAGTWKLRVRDLASPDTGTVTSWALLLPACNIAPQASIVLVPGLLNAGTPITLDASGSSDRDDAIAEYRWDYDGNGTIDEVTSGPLASHTFGAAGTVDPTVTVVDARGATGSRSLTLTVLPRIADTEGTKTGSPPPPPKKPAPPVTKPAAKRLTVKGLPRAAACPRPAVVKVRVSAPKGTKLKSISLFLGKGLRGKLSGKRVTRRLRLGRQPSSPHTVKIVARTTRGETLRYSKRYGTCLVSR